MNCRKCKHVTYYIWGYHDGRVEEVESCLLYKHHDKEIVVNKLF